MKHTKTNRSVSAMAALMDIIRCSRKRRELEGEMKRHISLSFRWGTMAQPEHQEDWANRIAHLRRELREEYPTHEELREHTAAFMRSEGTSYGWAKIRATLEGEGLI